MMRKKKTSTKSVTKKTSKRAVRPRAQKVTPRTVVAEIVDPATDLEHQPLPSEEWVGDEAPPAAPESHLPVPVASRSGALDPVATYLAEIRKYSLLTPEQERELAIRYFETKDPKAAELLVTSNLRFVVKIAAEYSKFGARLIDLIQEGNIGLMQAVKEFNPYKGVRLITYAVWWIRGYIQEYLMRQYSLVRIGTTQNQRKLFYQLQKQREQLEAIGQQPDYAMLSARLGIPEHEIESMQQRLSGRDVSLNQPLDSDSESSLMDFQASQTDSGVEEQLSRHEELAHLLEHLSQIRDELNEKELYILDHRLLADEPMTLQEIGERYGTTREAVRQVESRLMSKIKKRFVERE